MRVSLCILCLILVAPAAAQAPLFPDAAELRPVAYGAAAPHWRMAVGPGLVVAAFSPSLAVSAERSWRGPFALGGRGWAVTSTGYVADGAWMTGGGGEGFVVARTQGRWLDLRASAGLGLAVVDYGVASIGCELEFGPCGDEPDAFAGAAPYGLVGLGADLYVLPGVGLGGELRGALMAVPANVTTVEVGLRVRLAR